jgi:GGDEF domain-containing protein
MALQVLRVLLAESGATETGIILRALCANQGRNLDLIFVSKRDSLAHALLHFNPNVAFLALALLQPEPLLAVALLHASAPHIPLILFALPADRARAAECLRSGAKAYMLEGYMDGPTLEHVLHAATQDAIAVAPSVDSRARVDSLTSLLNRSGLLERLQHSHVESPLADSCLIFSIHLRHQRELLAAAGKPFMDRTLQRIAQHLVRCVRRSDLLAHVSNGVFVIVVANSNSSCLLALRRRIESALLDFTQREFQRMPWYFSIQDSTWRNNSSRSFGEILSSHLSPKKRLGLLKKDSPVPVLTAAGVVREA